MVLIGLLIISGIVYYLYKTNSGKIRKSIKNHQIGTNGENDIAVTLSRMGLNGYIFRNLYITFKNGRSTEIDLVFVTDRKIYVIESKNYNGMIFGDEYNKNWTVRYRNGKTYTFYNPIMQNITHINALKSMGIPEHLLESIVTFGVASDISNVSTASSCITINNLQQCIYNSYSKSTIRLSQPEIGQITTLLGSLTGAGAITKMKHINQINKYHR